MIGGYYKHYDDLAREVANIIEDEDVILIQGSNRNGKFYKIKDQLIMQAQKSPQLVNLPKVPSTGYDVATYKVSTGEKIAYLGNQKVIQN
ncbi:hypothetical protein [Staphylococcus sp. HMSC072E01]|uniref:hypothetical protein n=1 Tax=Staphylococcus sp. HMSC072E01 TaxID=1739457 RepID=UPI00210B2764|nr:hypothetical protein [Staphylococcus sp. HMSC072E01]